MKHRIFEISVGYFAMVLFIVIPVLKVMQGDMFTIELTLLSLAFALGFGFYATRQYMKYEKENENKKTGEHHG